MRPGGFSDALPSVALFNSAGPDFKHDRAAVLPSGVEADVVPMSKLGSATALEEHGPSGQGKGVGGHLGGEIGSVEMVGGLGTGAIPPVPPPAGGVRPAGGLAGGADVFGVDTQPDAT